MVRTCCLDFFFLKKKYNTVQLLICGEHAHAPSLACSSGNWEAKETSVYSPPVMWVVPRPSHSRRSRVWQWNRSYICLNCLATHHESRVDYVKFNTVLWKRHKGRLQRRFKDAFGDQCDAAHYSWKSVPFRTFLGNDSAFSGSCPAAVGTRLGAQFARLSSTRFSSAPGRCLPVWPPHFRAQK